MKNNILIILSLILLTNCGSEDNSNKNLPEIKDNAKEYVSFIHPPFGTSINFTLLTIDPSKDTLIQFESGSFLEIPKNCFVDINGEPLTKAAQIKFREFDSNEDIFLSGIPMEYNDENGNHNFESAGMCEIKPVDNIQFAKGKELTIGLNSQSADTNFDLYSFDEKSGKWEVRGKDSVYTPKETTEAKNIEPAKNSFEQKTAPEPVKPVKLDHSDPRLITLTLANEEYVPELRKYENVLFRVSEKSKYIRGESNKAWYYVEVKNTDTKGLYKLKFYGKSDEGEEINLEYFVEPALEGKDYETAIAEYDELFADYEKVKADIVESNRKAQEEQEKKWEAEELERVKTQNEIDKNELKINNAKEVIQRIFAVREFAIYNCDRFYGLDSFKELFVDCKDSNNDKINFQSLFLIDNSTRATLPLYQFDKIYLSADKPISYWGVTSTGKLATLNSYELGKWDAVSDEVIILKFKTTDVSPSEPEDIKRKIRASF